MMGTYCIIIILIASGVSLVPKTQIDYLYKVLYLIVNIGMLYKFCISTLSLLVICKKRKNRYYKYTQILHEAEQHNYDVAITSIGIFITSKC